MLPFRVIVLLSLMSLALVACGSTTPQVRVIGVSHAKRSHSQTGTGKVMVVFVEVVNPTDRKLNLSRLEYELAAEDWFSSTGKVTVSRPIGAKSTAVLEIPVPFSEPKAAKMVAYTLKGTLYADDHDLLRSWNIHVNGVLDSSALAASSARIRVRIAGSGD